MVQRLAECIQQLYDLTRAEAEETIQIWLSDIDNVKGLAETMYKGWWLING